MLYKLNDLNICEAMHRKYQSANDVGKVFLTIPSLNLEEDAERVERLARKHEVYCGNCDGTGTMYLTVFVGGPYATPAQKKHVTWHEGMWYEQDNIGFVCPDCNGTGLFSRQAPRPAPVSL